MSTMVAEPYVNHIPTMTGGVGVRELATFLRAPFHRGEPSRFDLLPVSRTVGKSSLVTVHVRRTPLGWTCMLPGIEPTGRAVEIPTVAIVQFQETELVQ